MDMEKKIKVLIAEQLGIDEDVIKPDSRFDEDLGADSLDVVELVMTAEEEFEIEVQDEEFADVRTVQDAVNLIKKKAPAQPN